MNIDLVKVPEPSLNSILDVSTYFGSDVYTYLRLVSNNKHFATDTLEILLEERRKFHHNRAKRRRYQIMFKPRDLVMDHMLVQFQMH